MFHLEYDYFTKYRGHYLPRLKYFSSNKEFLNNDLEISSRIPNLSHLSVKSEIENKLIEKREEATSETMDHSRYRQRKYFILPTLDVSEPQPLPTPLPASPSKRTHHRREIPSPVQKRTKLECSDDELPDDELPDDELPDDPDDDY